MVPLPLLTASPALPLPPPSRSLHIPRQSLHRLEAMVVHTFNDFDAFKMGGFFILFSVGVTGSEAAINTTWIPNILLLLLVMLRGFRSVVYSGALLLMQAISHFYFFSITPSG